MKRFLAVILMLLQHKKFWLFINADFACGILDLISMTCLPSWLIKLPRYRRYQRAGRRGDVPERTAAKVIYCEARKSFRLAIRASQEQCWRELCQTVDSNPWGVLIRIVSKKLNRRAPRIESHGREDAIADHLFPSHPIIDWSTIPMVNLVTSLEITEEPYTPIQHSELVDAEKRLPNNKAPGPDGVPNEVIRHTIRLAPIPVPRVFDECLRTGVFPVS